ncbi:patatin-like phospholipase family protein [Cellulosilyticum ruminicola]|uniref:patatin-like phospholipase family protein n=1 Tax=Cellulosilyticum ruminicola TaxID=425254 RepID=UPI0006D11616|nr:patatin-like phospholipase family protein [Cellulosilyticum ruminicola]
MSLFRILSIDGGGIRGIIPATLLVYLEECLQKNSSNKDARIADYFDLIAGTSTGGILTALYLTPDENNRPRYTAQNALDFYLNYGQTIFYKSFWHTLISLNGLLGAKYSPKHLNELLQNIFGSLRLSEFLKPCLIPSFDIKNNRALFFNQTDCLFYNKDDFFVRHIIRATTAAPTYFPVAQINSCENTSFSLIDGGVFANNPALCAYTECQKLTNHYLSPNDILILSLGTGVSHKNLYTRFLNSGGVTQWAFPLFDILLSSNAEIVHHKLKVLYDDDPRIDDNYLRIQTHFDSYNVKEFSLDSTSSSNIRALHALAELVTNDYKSKIDDFSKRLISGK